MVKLSDLLVDKSLHKHGMDRRDVIRSPVWFSWRHLTNTGIVTLTIDGVALFLQLLEVQMYVKMRVSVKIRVAGNSDSLFKMAESL